MEEIKIDPEFKALIPPLTEDEYKGLEAKILNYGCMFDLITWNGTLLDGHNRLEICRKHGIPFKTQPMVFKDRTSAKIWIYENQASRRNTSPSQKAMLATECAKLKAHRPGTASCEAVKTQDEAAKLFGVGRSSVQRARKVSDEGSEELIQAVKNNEVSVNAASKVVDLPKEKQLEAAKNKQEQKQETKKEEKENREAIKELMRNASCAVAFAQDAINFLRKIRKDDPHRTEALEMVYNWLEENK